MVELSLSLVRVKSTSGLYSTREHLKKSEEGEGGERGSRERWSREGWRHMWLNFFLFFVDPTNRCQRCSQRAEVLFGIRGLHELNKHWSCPLSPTESLKATTLQNGYNLCNFLVLQELLLDLDSKLNLGVRCYK